MTKHKFRIKFKNIKADFVYYDLKIPSILWQLNSIDWNQILCNLSLDDKYELVNIVNRCYYSDKYNHFHKSFGFKSKNWYDLSLTPINKISDVDIFMDEHDYTFSYQDLKKLPFNSYHPYLKSNSIQIIKAKNSHLSIIDYFHINMSKSLRKNTSQSSLASDIGESDDLEQKIKSFEALVNHDYFTTNLISIYIKYPQHLHYTIGLLYYIISIIEDYKNRYEHILKIIPNNYNELIHIFLDNYTTFLIDIKSRQNSEKFQYVCIIIFKILQYRYNIIVDSDELFNTIKSDHDQSSHLELYWSMNFDRPNYYYHKITNKMSFGNINIDSIFSNCEYNSYYYTLMIYLHDKYMGLPTLIDRKLAPLLNCYKTADNYSYHDVIKYFMNLHHYILTETPELYDLYRIMIDRYYLKKSPIYITTDGIVCE